VTSDRIIALFRYVRRPFDDASSGPAHTLCVVRKEHPRVAGIVPRSITLPGGLRGVERAVLIAPERLRHIRVRRPQWIEFVMRFMRDTIEGPDFLGQRAHGDRRRVEFVRLVDTPGRWLLVSVKFLDDRGEAWGNSAHPVADAYLTRRLAAGTMWQARRGP
jgi:hypothetical protein